MPVDVSWLNLLIQIPLAGIVVFLTIRFLAHLEKLNRDNQDATTKREAATLDFISKQEEINREFLKAQREQMNEATARLAEEIKNNKVDTLRELANLVNLVDKVIDKIENITDKLQNITFMNIQEKKGRQ